MKDQYVTAYPMPPMTMEDGKVIAGTCGMSLLDHYAGLAMTALVHKLDQYGTIKGVANNAYMIAEAMMQVRGQQFKEKEWQSLTDEKIELIRRETQFTELADWETRFARNIENVLRGMNK